MSRLTYEITEDNRKRLNLLKAFATLDGKELSLQVYFFADNDLVLGCIEIYDVLKKGGREKLCSVFKQTVNGLYCTDCGYKRFITLTEKKESQSSYDSKSYNGAWRKHV